MQEKQLRQIMSYALEALETNRKVVTPLLIAKAQDWLTSYREDADMRAIIAAAFQIADAEVLDYFDKAQQILELEKKLIQTDLTDTIADGLIRLQNRPIVMRMVAALL